MDPAKKIIERITRARQDRASQAMWIDESMRLAMPTFRRIGNKTSPASRAEEQDDLFDTELQVTVEDFASDMISTFTPRHDRWLKFEAATELSDADAKIVGEQLKLYEQVIFDDIERSNYWEAAQEAFSFWAVSNMACTITKPRPLQPILFSAIEMADLLLESAQGEGFNGIWREMSLDQMGMHELWPDAFEPPKPSEKRKIQKVVDGIDRVIDATGEDRFIYRVLVADKQKFARTYEGEGSSPMVACRFRRQSGTAWGPGPVHKALPDARKLDELTYLNLKGLGRAADPPWSYEEDSVTNFDQGIENGMMIPRAAGSRPPEPMLPDMRFDATAFNIEMMRKAIKRALYQDRPEQPGLTPPTLGQWQDQKAWNTRRRELPRDRCVREWVVPIVQRVAHLAMLEGRLEPIRLKGGGLVKLKPVSPMSKAKDMEDLSTTNEIAQMGLMLGQLKQSGVNIDVAATLAAIKQTADERHLVMMSEEQIAQEMAMQAAAQAAAKGNLEMPQ